MMKRFLVFLFILCACLSVSLRANEFILASDVGASAYHIGLANIEGFSQTSSGLFENPAALHRIQDYSAEFFHARLMEVVLYNNFSYAKKTRLGTFAVGYMDVSIPDNEITGEDNSGRHVVLDTFVYRNWLLKGSYQRSLTPSVHWGASLNLFGEQLHKSSALSHNFDTGMVFVDGKNTFSALIRNIAIDQDIAFENAGSDKTKAELTPEYVGAYRRAFTPRFAGFFQLKVKQQETLWAVASEVMPLSQSWLKVFGGVKQELVANRKQERWSMGLALLLGDLHLAYTYEDSDHVTYQNNSYFSVSINL